MPRNIEPLLGLLASILVILIAVANSIAIGYALIVVWCIMAYVFYRKGYAPKELLNLSWTGAKTSIVVMQIFLLIGWLIAMWQAAGVIPMNVNMNKIIDVDLDVNGESVTVSSVLLGVPHTEVFIDDITKAPVTTQGPILEKHDVFPANTNVNYIEVVNDKHIKVRTWERGAGATLACGTGSCASAVMSFEKGLTGREVDVELYLGTLHISYLEDGTVLMTGPAEEVFETELPID